MKPIISLLFLIAAASFPLSADESLYYEVTPFVLPTGEEIETTGIALMEDGALAVSTRRGRIWKVTNALSGDPATMEWSIFAEYLHDPLGLAWRDGWLYATQRPEVTRMRDSDGDGAADVFVTVADGWGISGDYHEYNFGSRFDDQGNLYAALCLTGSSRVAALYRGWVVKVDPRGAVTPLASGVRSPGGIGFNPQGDIFYTDNQGVWNGSSSLKWVKPGSFLGNPNGNVFAARDSDKSIVEPSFTEQGRLHEAMETVTDLIPPAVIFPHNRLGASPTGIEPDLSEGKFGPFAGQLFVAEQTNSMVQRVFLEKIGGLYQGVAFPFLKGFRSGNVGLFLSDDGVMFTGGTNRSWGARGPDSSSLERIRWTGKTPFEVHEMRVTRDGFELRFTEPIDPDTAVSESFACEAFTYEYGKLYGSPEVDAFDPTIAVNSVSEDQMTVKLTVEPMTLGHVYAFNNGGLRSESGLPLLHPEAYYTLNALPQASTP
ncbi:MAG: hypothetical protein AAF236_06390 [Verrucomicrobiota bacterium]